MIWSRWEGWRTLSWLVLSPVVWDRIWDQTVTQDKFISTFLRVHLVSNFQWDDFLVESNFIYVVTYDWTLLQSNGFEKKKKNVTTYYYIINHQTIMMRCEIWDEMYLMCIPGEEKNAMDFLLNLEQKILI